MVECLKRYLLAQRVVVPGMAVTVVTCLLSPLYNWLFIFKYVSWVMLMHLQAYVLMLTANDRMRCYYAAAAQCATPRTGNHTPHEQVTTR